MKIDIKITANPKRAIELPDDVEAHVIAGLIERYTTRGAIAVERVMHMYRLRSGLHYVCAITMTPKEGQ